MHLKIKSWKINIFCKILKEDKHYPLGLQQDLELVCGQNLGRCLAIFFHHAQINQFVLMKWSIEWKQTTCTENGIFFRFYLPGNKRSIKRFLAIPFHQIYGWNSFKPPECRLWCCTDYSSEHGCCCKWILRAFPNLMGTRKIFLLKIYTQSMKQKLAKHSK